MGRRNWCGLGFARWLQRGIGAFLVFAAAAKIADFDAFLEKAAYYRAVPYEWMVRSAWTTVVVEVVLGVLLITGRGLRLAVPATISMLLLFTLLIAYAWRTYGITDCGCLGGLVETPPWLSVAKNLTMAGALLGVGRGSRSRMSADHSWRACRAQVGP